MNKLELITANLIDTIKKLAEEAEEIYILTSFTMLSGVRRILLSNGERVLRYWAGAVEAYGEEYLFVLNGMRFHKTMMTVFYEVAFAANLKRLRRVNITT